MKHSLLLRLQAALAASLLLLPCTALQAREHEGGDDHGGGGSGGQGGGGNGGGHDDPVESEFVGRVQTLPAGSTLAGVWQVNGVSFVVNGATVIDQSHGAIAVGSLVEVHGAQQADGSILASKVQDEDERAEDFGEAEFVGQITALPSTPGFIGTWTVGDRTVTVDVATALDTERGAIALGATVEVHGSVLSDGSVGAARIQVEDVTSEDGAEDAHFTGVIEVLPASGLLGTWTVSGLTVLVDDRTRIEAEGTAVAVGATVRFEGVQQADGSIVASEINLARAAFGDDSAECTAVGEIEHLPGNSKRLGNWTVDGVTVTVTPGAVFDLSQGRKGRKAHEGDEVEVHGRRQPDGSILVTTGVLEFEGHETGRHFLKYEGVVANVLPATATAAGSLILSGGQVLRFDDHTKFSKGVPAIGDTVSVKATGGSNGIDNAIKVQVK